MSFANPVQTATPAIQRTRSIQNNVTAAHQSTDQTYNNPNAYPSHHQHHHHDILNHPPHTGHHNSNASHRTMDKKGKGKKAPDPNEASKLIAAKISQLELDAAGEKDQEAEIEREVRKANREFNSQTSKYDDTAKIEALQRRCTDLLGEMKRLERENLKNKKKGDLLQKEKDHSRTELSKNVSLREKLEKLCRELQRENNRLKGENKTLLDADKSNHESWDIKYADVLWQLQAEQLRKDSPPIAPPVNMEMDELFKQRFKSLIDQYELRELHFHSLMRTKELEVQMNMARYEKERKTAEAELARSRALNAQVLTFSKTEAELRSQLNIYVEKFKQVEDTLNNSNDLFLTFRKEMEEMSKKTKRLEKENLTLTRKHDLTNRNILEMAEERTKANSELELLRKTKKQLTDIIKQMQEQGRGLPNGGSANMLEGNVEYGEGQAGTDESEYEEDYGEVSEEGEYDEDTEEELHVDDQQQQQQLVPQPFGPVPPPPPQQTNGAVNFY